MQSFILIALIEAFTNHDQMIKNYYTDEDPSLWIESFAILNLRGVCCTKLYFNGELFCFSLVKQFSEIKTYGVS